MFDVLAEAGIIVEYNLTVNGGEIKNNYPVVYDGVEKN